HRDIKPDNIIFINGEPVLSDPGLICSLDLSISLAGSLGFLPPECFAGKENNSIQSDIFALGKVFYCAVTGEAPGLFPKLPRDLSYSLCRKILPVLLRACNEKKKRRYNDIAGFREALPKRLPRPGFLSRQYEQFRIWRLMHSTWWHGVLAVLVLGVCAAVYGAYRAEEIRRKQAEELRLAAKSVQSFVRQFRSGQVRLGLQLEHLIGEAKTAEIIKRFKHLPEDPKAARAVCGELRELLRKTLRAGLAEAWKTPDPLRRSGEVRSLLFSPLGSFADATEMKAQQARLLADETRHFPQEELSPHPGKTFSPDSSHIFMYSYIPPGEYISPRYGRKNRIDYPFWVLQTELTVRQYSHLRVEVPLGNNSGNGRPVRRLLWNDLLTACYVARRQLLVAAELPPGYIIRPLTEDEWEYCATAGKGRCVPDENAWCRENPFRELPEAGSLPPNAFGLHDLLGGMWEMVISDRREHPDSFIARGGAWNIPRANLPKARKELVFYQSFVNTLGARLAIAPGRPDLLEKELRYGTPNHTVRDGRHFEFFGHLGASYTREDAEELCRALGGKLASIDSEELLKKIIRNASPAINYPTCVGADLRNGRWVWKNGVPVANPPAKSDPKGRFVLEDGKFKLRKFSKYLGFVCEWNGQEWDSRHRWRSRVKPMRILTEFTIGDRHYILFRHCTYAYPHLLRRYAEIIGGKLAEPESAELRAAIAEKTRYYQTAPTLLGGFRRFHNFYWTSGNQITGQLPLTGRQPDNALSLATPAMVNGKLCSVQMAFQYLVEFPAGSAAE
ncbi:MAG: SUMF1/EgtB/PvdO family nonheme iron enzyme, partial [Lentisphaeria bacterium]|nr:SUMF1/EgtB/PvdO family nonheme iron enzyme [Lentisphaeria bacterium]